MWALPASADAPTPQIRKAAGTEATRWYFEKGRRCSLRRVGAAVERRAAITPEVAPKELPGLPSLIRHVWCDRGPREDEVTMGLAESYSSSGGSGGIPILGTIHLAGAFGGTGGGGRDAMPEAGKPGGVGSALITW